MPLELRLFGAGFALKTSWQFWNCLVFLAFCPLDNFCARIEVRSGFSIIYMDRNYLSISLNARYPGCWTSFVIRITGGYAIWSWLRIFLLFGLAFWDYVSVFGSLLSSQSNWLLLMWWLRDVCLGYNELGVLVLILICFVVCILNRQKKICLFF